jgi:exocyst complex component 1
LTEDIAYIEAQGQGLQVQTANQKLLQAELKNLLETINIPSQQLNHLRNGNIISIEGLESTERAVLALYKALLLIDPSIKQNTDNSSQQAVEYQSLSKMRALQEKKIGYLNESASFLIRLRNYMDISYGQAGLEVETSIKSRSSLEKSNAKLTVEDLDVGRSILWKYSPLMLYAKELDGSAWKELMQSYQLKMRPLYSDTLLEAIQGYKKLARGSPGDEQELLFTLNENQLDGLAATTRKLTVKRSGTLARTFRAGSGEKASRTAGAQNGALLPCEAFAEALDEMTPLILTEQNFVVDFFHASTTETLDFAETVQAALPESRRALHSLTRKGYEPDQAMIQLVTGVLGDLFSFLPNELQNLVTWAINMGPLQGVGILHALYHVMASLDDNYFFRTLYSLVTRITTDWSRFMDEQIRAIEDTKVKIKKRKGVIYFMKVFPSFSAHVENMLPPASGANGEVRALVDQAYERLNKAMFESLRVIAKESPSNAPHGGAGDPEDKEALNYHILLIENMNHYVEFVDDRGDRVLEQGKQKAKEELEDHLSLYVDAVIRRPLGKIMVSEFGPDLSIFC